LHQSCDKGSQPLPSSSSHSRSSVNAPCGPHELRYRKCPTWTLCENNGLCSLTRADDSAASHRSIMLQIELRKSSSLSELFSGNTVVTKCYLESVFMSISSQSPEPAPRENRCFRRQSKFYLGITGATESCRSYLQTILTLLQGAVVPLVWVLLVPFFNLDCTCQSAPTGIELAYLQDA
jgi:hypothetical protein